MYSILSIFASSKNISLRAYNKFIDTGKISDAILENIAKKVIKNETLNERESTVFFSKTLEVNEIISKLHKQ
jgi:hypothetical protein